MILTVTPNPSIDLLFEAEQLVWDDANRLEMPRRRAGGQGINLTRATRALGGESIALAFLGGRSGDELRSLLEEDGTPHVVVPTQGETRVFVGVRENATGRSMLLNARGPILTAEDRERLLAAVQATLAQQRVDWLVCSGSIPRGLGDDVYAEIAGVARSAAVRFVADCDGEPLKQAVAAGCDLLVPNQHEAERLLGRQIETIADAVVAANELRSQASRVLIKVGEQGALAADEQGCWRASAPRLRSGSAVGAGDAFLAGFLVADASGAPLSEALRCAVAAGAAVVLSKDRSLLERTDYDALLADVQLSRV